MATVEVTRSYRASGQDLVRGGESLPRSGPRFRSFVLAIARRSVCHETFDQLCGRACHFVDGGIEGRLIGAGGPGKPRQLANELQCRRPDLVRGRRGFKVEERLDVSAHL